jgi:DNA-binding NarL/FixJ family response regulator
MAMSKPIRILIADNDPDFSKHLKSFLEQQEDLHVIEILRDGHGAVSACKDSLPDLVVIDLHLPVLDSIRTIQSILAQNDLVKILTISSVSNDRYAVEAIKAGARGFVEKNGAESLQEIEIAIRQVATGEVVLNSALASRILREFS